jgi:2-dehydropantoate 2-reductase
MRIAVMGAGSVGGYFGGLLARSGNSVTLIARGPHLKAVREQGLRIVTDQGELFARCKATDDPAQVGPVDLVLLAVKTYHNPEALPAMLPMVGEETVVLCLQNGIDSHQAAVDTLGAEHVMPAVAYIEAGLPEPGVVTQRGPVVRIEFGELQGGDSQRGRQILQALEHSGIPAGFEPDIHLALWNKFLFIATMAGVTTMARQTMAQLLPRPEWRRVILGCWREIESVGRASGVGLAPDVVDRSIKYIEGSLEQRQASMHFDILAGRPLELEALNGAVVRAGRKAGVPTPINDVIYAMLGPFAGGQPRPTSQPSN